MFENVALNKNFFIFFGETNQIFFLFLALPSGAARSGPKKETNNLISFTKKNNKQFLFNATFSNTRFLQKKKRVFYIKHGIKKSWQKRVTEYEIEKICRKDIQKI